ncbi:hypothetical protein SynWH8103_00497 [Synechococcus sp. WH 8103]|nr:hypothetical protein SynWH8103_00497 [Synechococcus sp. WH 8103]
MLIIAFNWQAIRHSSRLPQLINFEYFAFCSLSDDILCSSCRFRLSFKAFLIAQLFRHAC